LVGGSPQRSGVINRIGEPLFSNGNPTNGNTIDRSWFPFFFARNQASGSRTAQPLAAPFLVGGFLQPGERFCRSWLAVSCNQASGFAVPGWRFPATRRADRDFSGKNSKKKTAAVA
jgi:hypothetical protein